MSKMIHPCYHCNDREIGCHSRCSKYKNWKDQHIVETSKISAQDAIYEMQREFRSGFKQFDLSSSYHKRQK